MDSSPITATWYPTTSIPGAWTELGETTILKTSRRSIGGATGKRDLWPVPIVLPLHGRTDPDAANVIQITLG